VQRAIRDGYRVAVDLDLERFFDRVEHDVRMVRVSSRVTDKTLLRLVGQYLRAGVQVDGQLQPTRRGVPQGGPLSPILSNIVLDSFDKELEGRGHRFARYADDAVILVRSPRAGQRVMASVTEWLRVHLKLEVNAEKSQVTGTSKISFLGFRFWGAKICWSADTVKRLEAEVRRLTNRNWGVSMRRRLRELASYLRGWMAYFGLSSHYRLLPELVTWIRRRTRMCYWVQWRWRPTRFRRLLALGVPRHWAIRTGFSSKGPWHMSRSYAINAALSDAYLAEQGLVSIRDLWIQSAPLRRTA
jgi:RNA-directed DNA polymerase